MQHDWDDGLILECNAQLTYRLLSSSLVYDEMNDSYGYQKDYSLRLFPELIVPLPGLGLGSEVVWDIENLLISAFMPGHYQIVNCSCGVPDCSDVEGGIFVHHPDDEFIIWEIPLFSNLGLYYPHIIPDERSFVRLRFLRSTYTQSICQMLICIQRHLMRPYTLEAYQNLFTIENAPEGYFDIDHDVSFLAEEVMPYEGCPVRSKRLFMVDTSRESALRTYAEVYGVKPLPHRVWVGFHDDALFPLKKSNQSAPPIEFHISRYVVWRAWERWQADLDAERDQITSGTISYDPANDTGMFFVKLFNGQLANSKNHDTVMLYAPYLRSSNSRHINVEGLNVEDWI